MATLTLNPTSGTADVGGSFTNPSYTALDDSGNSIASPTVTAPTVDTSTAGTQTLTYTLTAAGNTGVAADTTATFTLTVQASTTSGVDIDKFVTGDQLRNSEIVTGSKYDAAVDAENADETVTTKQFQSAWFDQEGLDPYEVANAKANK